MRHYLFSFFIALTSYCYSQNDYAFKHFGVSDGLPSTEVYQIIQDSEGYVWLATDRGVCKYDGYRFTNYSRKDGLTDEVVFGFYLEENGRLWFYTYQGGLCYYEGGKIIEPEFNFNLKTLLKEHGNPIIVSLIINPDGSIIIGTKLSQLIEVNKNGVPRIIYENESEANNSVVFYVGEERKSLELVYSSGSGISFPSVFIKHAGKDSLIKLNDFNSIEDKSRNFKSGIAYRIDEKTFAFAFGTWLYKIENGVLTQKVNLGQNNEVLYALKLDKHKNLWIGTKNGVFSFAEANLYAEPKHYLKSNAISSIWVDHENGYWFSSLDDGLFYSPHFKVQSISSKELNGNKPEQIVTNSSGVYLGTTGDNLIYFPEGKFDSYEDIEGSHSNNTPMVSLDDKIIVQSSESFRAYVETKFLRNKAFDQLPAPIVKNDDQSELLWSHLNDSLKIISMDQPRKTSFVSVFKGRLRSFAAAKDFSIVWVGGDDGLMELKNDSLYKLQEKWPQFTTRITDLDLLSKQYLLVTTRGSGVFLYDYQNKKVEKLDGVLNEYCNQSYVDSLGVVWVSSFSGITRIDSITTRVRYSYFTESDGLISNETYSIGEYGGQIWVSSRNGISRWAKEWVPKRLSTSVDIERVMVNGEVFTDDQMLSLSFDQNDLFFEFKGIRFQYPIEYEYRLRGLHSNWITTTTPNASYTSLSPGSYVFELKSVNDNEAHSSINCVISPPFWRSSWFIIAIVIILLSLIGLLLRLRYRIISKESKLYELFVRSEQKALRAQINPHFLFNCFSSILELLIQQEYRRATQYMSRLSSLMRMILKYSREDSITIREEVDLLKLYVHLEQLRFENKFDFELEVNKSIPMETKLPSLLLQPYVENAIKHGISSRKVGRGRLSIFFEKEGNHLLISIIDNGKGFQKIRKGNGFGMKINGERLDLFNRKDRFKVEIYSIYNKFEEYPGTVVRIKLPL